MNRHMPDTQGTNKLSVVRGILEAVIVLALAWTSSTLVSLKVDNGVLKEQTSTIVKNTSDLPALRVDVAQLKIEMASVKDDVKDLKQVKNLR